MYNNLVLYKYKNVFDNIDFLEDNSISVENLYELSICIISHMEINTYMQKTVIASFTKTNNNFFMILEGQIIKYDI